MNFSSPDKAAAIAERAYFIYLKRVEQGLPGDEHNDWLQAVAENEAPPAPPMGAKTSGDGPLPGVKKRAHQRNPSPCLQSRVSVPKLSKSSKSAESQIVPGWQAGNRQSWTNNFPVSRRGPAKRNGWPKLRS